MELVDLIIRAKYVITMGDPLVIGDGAVAIKDRVIVSVDRADRVMSNFKAEEVIERGRHILMPGLIDAHTHTQQVFLRSFVNDRRLSLPQIWTKLLIPFEDLLTDDLAYLSSLVSVVGMVKNGITTFIEAGAPKPLELIRAVNEVGIRGIITPSTFDIGENKLLDTKEVIRRVEDLLPHVNDRVRVWCSIRQIMMASPELLMGVRDFCLRHGLGITYHMGEYQGEIDYSFMKYGKRPLEVFDELGLTGIKPTVIAHGVYLSIKERGIIKERGLGIAWCPTVDSIYMGPHWLPLFGDYMFGIGSDGGGFTDLDLFHEARVARAVGKALTIGINYDKSSFNTITLMRALTGWGGRLINDNVGVMRPGYRADLVTLRLDDPRILPIHDPVETVITALSGRDVNDVLVNGEFIVNNSNLVKVDEVELINKIYDVTPTITDKLREFGM
jgi:5-methylthioadenosine/S-adenosylhomocysteine deaminase